jgi:protein-tyrosine phosphatase
MAEFVLKDMVKKWGIAGDFYIESAATTREEIGNPVYPPARKKLAEHGLRCDGKVARLMTRRDYEEFDYIIGMDQENRYDMKRIVGGDPEGRLSCLMDYTDHPREVADPWYTRNFDATWRDVCEGCEAFLNYLGYQKP